MLHAVQKISTSKEHTLQLKYLEEDTVLALDQNEARKMQ